MLPNANCVQKEHFQTSCNPALALPAQVGRIKTRPGPKTASVVQQELFLFALVSQQPPSASHVQRELSLLRDLAYARYVESVLIKMISVRKLARPVPPAHTTEKQDLSHSKSACHAKRELSPVLGLGLVETVDSANIRTVSVVQLVRNAPVEHSPILLD